MGDDDHFYNDEELVASNANERNWRGIIIAVLVIMFVCALIVTSVVLLTPPDEGPRIKGRRLKLDDILGHDFTPLRFNGSWISDHEFVFRDSDGGVSVFNATTLTSHVLMPNVTFKKTQAVRFSVSPDLKFVLLACNIKKLYRHTFLAQYILYDVDAEITSDLGPTREETMLLYAGWAPRGNALVMVHDYDIYYKTAANSDTVHRVTDTAIPGVVTHGVPDWVYEEEILNSNHALWFSADGRMLLFATFNDSLVEEHQYLVYGTLEQQMLYPEVQKLRYPKPGTTNPSVTLWVVDLSDLRNIRPKDLKPPLAVRDQDHYFTAVRWVSNDQVAVVWMNRAQNLSLVTVCRSSIWFCQETQRISSETRGWVEMYDPPVFSRDGNSYLIRAPVLDGDKGFFLHVTLVNIQQKRSDQITYGDFEVRKILGWDQIRNRVYYAATPPGRPGQQHIYSVMAERPFNARTPECLTCDMDMENATASKCLYHQGSFSSSFQYYVLECLGPDVPYVTLHSVTNNSVLVVLQNNTLLRERAAAVAFPQVKQFGAEIAGGFVAQVRLFLPPGLRVEEITKYPLVVQVYGGPGSQLVTDRWNLDWASYLSGKKNFIVAQVDGRGSGGQGLRLLREVYLHLGAAEVEDQLAVSKYLAETLHYVDERRVAIFGWSYGGFVASMAMAREQEVFKCGIAIAPVTNWRLYDSVYTERYMGSPNVTGNYKGYEEADITRQVEHFRDKMFYLIHGTADDNVHFQQSMMLSRALTENGILFRQQVYPDENHNLNGVKPHLYRSMENFFDDCFRKYMPAETKLGLKEGGEEEEEE